MQNCRCNRAVPYVWCSSLGLAKSPLFACQDRLFSIQKKRQSFLNSKKKGPSFLSLYVCVIRSKPFWTPQLQLRLYEPFFSFGPNSCTSSKWCGSRQVASRNTTRKVARERKPPITQGGRRAGAHSCLVKTSLNNPFQCTVSKTNLLTKHQ